MVRNKNKEKKQGISFHQVDYKRFLKINKKNMLYPIKSLIPLRALGHNQCSSENLTLTTHKTFHFELLSPNTGVLNYAKELDKDRSQMSPKAS